jgi:hypothetical protein
MANKAMKSPDWQARKARRDSEGAEAWKEYVEQQLSISERIARQRAARLERERSAVHRESPPELPLRTVAAATP